MEEIVSREELMHFGNCNVNVKNCKLCFRLMRLFYWERDTTDE